MADNTVDLAEHYGEFEGRQAFAYSVLTPHRCIGCVYVEPWTDGAQLAFWVIDEVLDREGEIVAAVLDWLKSWPLERVAVVVRPWNQRAQAALQAIGLKPRPGPPDHVSFGER